MTVVRYIRREAFLVFIVTFPALTILAGLGSLLQLYRHIAGLGLRLLLATAPAVIGYVAPWTLMISATVAVTVVLARLATDGEIEAIRTSGIPISVTLQAMVPLGLACAVVSATLSLWLTPKAFTYYWMAQKQAVRAFLRNPPPGRQDVLFGRLMLTYDGLDDMGYLRRPFIVERNEAGGIRREYIAQRACIVFEGDAPVLLMEGVTQRFTDAEGNQQETSAKALRLDIPLPQPRAEDVGLAGVPTNDLLRRMHTDPPPYDRRARAEFHSRVATALAPIALVLLALGAGLHVPRHARLAGLGVGLPVMAAFLSVHLAGAQWSEDWLPPAIGPYLADGAGALCGAVLILLHMRR